MYYKTILAALADILTAHSAHDAECTITRVSPQDIDATASQVLEAQKDHISIAYDLSTECLDSGGEHTVYSVDSGDAHLAYLWVWYDRDGKVTRAYYA